MAALSSLLPWLFSELEEDDSLAACMFYRYWIASLVCPTLSADDLVFGKCLAASFNGSAGRPLFDLRADSAVSFLFLVEFGGLPLFPIEKF